MAERDPIQTAKKRNRMLLAAKIDDDNGGHTVKNRLQLFIAYAMLDKVYQQFAAKDEIIMSEPYVINVKALEANH